MPFGKTLFYNDLALFERAESNHLCAVTAHETIVSYTYQNAYEIQAVARRMSDFLDIAWQLYTLHKAYVIGDLSL